MITKNISGIPILELPSKEKTITIKILGHSIPDPRKSHRNFGVNIMRCCMCEKENEIYYLELRSYIIKEISRECKKINIPIDKDLNCAVGKIFNISGKRLIQSSMRTWHRDEITGKLEPPMVHRFKLVESA